ncbi:DUF7344 domain-containing protein [Natrinema gelatinilyticum]|uniref:DUF7344 domain-containing protein n=1 Tax=Natrinema gelatinilyticum TaxID=2961571 RepID=UPI0020C34E19|nr:ArsR family transcriptional regulator [Natrinema gelatinilyticum]
MTEGRERRSASMLDDAFDALASHHRRRVLVALLDHNPQSDRVHAEGAVKESHTRADRDHLQTAMHHKHLPKLEAYGFIRWDKNTHEVEKGPAFDHIRPLLEVLDSHVTEFTDE